MAIDVRSGQVRAITSFEQADRFGVSWNMYVTPDSKTLYFRHGPRPGPGATRWHARICAMGVSGTDFRVVYDPPADLGGVWSFSCDFGRGVIEAVLTNAKGKCRVGMDLEGGNPHALEAQKPRGIFSVTADLLQDRQGEVAFVPRSRVSLEDFEPAGKEPSVSPDGSAVAFVREDHEVWCYRFADSHAVRLLAAKRGSVTRWRGSYAVAPVWSTEGRLLWFSSTTATRVARSQRPESTRPQNDLSAPREVGRGLRFEHRVGIIDRTDGRVWMADAHWHDVAFAP